MSCLDTLIGIKGKCGAQDTPQFFIQDLTGINRTAIDSALQADDGDLETFITDKISFGVKQVENDFQSAFIDKIIQRSVIEGNSIGFYRENLEALAADANYRGIGVRILEYPYLEFYVSSISLMVNFSGAVDIKVFDLIQNKLIDTISITAVAGQIVTVYPAKSYKTNGQRMNIIFVYDATAIPAYVTDVYGGAINAGCSNCQQSGNYFAYIIVNPVKIGINSPKIFDNLESNQGTGGLSITYNLSCSIEPLICKYANVFALPLLYKVGELLMQNSQYSQRINAATTQFKTDNIALAGKYAGQYNARMFGGTDPDGVSHVGLINTINIPSGDICWTCRQRISTKTVLP